jgi:hypothetical protein
MTVPEFSQTFIGGREMQLELDVEAGRTLRDAGIAKTLDHADSVVPSWRELAMKSLKEISDEKATFTAEDVRWLHGYLLRPEPPHHNAWGAVLKIAAKDGLIVKTGEYVQSKSVSARARILPVWRKAWR